MTLDDVRKALLQCRPSDWHAIACGGADGPSYLDAFDEWGGSNDPHWLSVESHHHRATYRADVSLSIAWGLGRMDDKREFPWLKRFADQGCYPSLLDVFWCGSLIDRHLGLVVDGGRAVLPWPTPEYDHADPAKPVLVSEVVTPLEVAAWRLANALESRLGDYDDYLSRVGFTVVEN